MNDKYSTYLNSSKISLLVSISFGIQRFVSNEDLEEKREREEKEEEEEEEEENELDVDDYEEEEATENIKNIKEEEDEEEEEGMEEEEDEESKGVTASKIKSQFANFSVLSLLARKTPEREEKVLMDLSHFDLDDRWWLNSQIGNGESEGGKEENSRPMLSTPKEEVARKRK